MSELIVTSLNGESELLTDHKELTRKRRVNSERHLSFKLIETDRNVESFNLTEEESILELDGQEYRIKRAAETTRGSKRTKSIEAEAKFVGDLIDAFQYNTKTGSVTLSFSVAINFALEPSNYTANVIDTFSNQIIENFGNDNSLALVNKVLETFGAEMVVDDTTKSINFYKRVVRSTEAQFRYKYNLKAIEKEVNTENLSTFIKGFGKKNEDGTYVTTATYTSPNAALFPADTKDGLRHAPPFYDERFTDQASLIEALQEAIIDVPEVSFKVDLIQLKDGGFEGDAREGDEIFVIHEPLGIDLIARIMEIEDYPGTNKAPQFTISNYRYNLADAVSGVTKGVNDLTGPGGTIKSSLLDIALTAAVEALKSAQTELKFENGILAIDKNDPNKIVILNSNGFGISDDGLVTVTSAITSAGIATELLTAGQINAAHISVKGGDDTNYSLIDENGFYAKGTAFSMERPDGYVVINDGILQNAFTVQGSEPPFATTGIEEIGQWYRGKSTNRFENVQRYVFKHDARYLRIVCNMSVDNGGGGNIGKMTFDVFKEADESIDVAVGTVTETRNGDPLGGGQGYRKEILIDLGVPTGDLLVCYWRLYNTIADWYTYGNIKFIGLVG